MNRTPPISLVESAAVPFGDLDIEPVAGVDPDVDRPWSPATRTNGKGVPAIQSAAEFVANFRSPEYVLDGVLQRGYTYSLTGRTGDGKTAVGMTIGAHMALGRSIAGRETVQGDVLMLAGENADDVRARMIVQCEALGVSPVDLPMHFISERFTIGDAIPILEQRIRQIGRPLVLILIDTSAAFFPGDDENDNVQAGAYARSLRSVVDCAEGRPCVITLSHPVKNAERDRLSPRGGGAFIAEIDGNLTLWSPAPGTAELHWQGKFRGPSFEPILWSLERKESAALVDAKGRRVPSVIASVMSEEAQQRLVAAARSDEDSVLENLLQFPGASYADRCRQLGWLSAKGDPSKSRLARVFEELIAEKLAKRQRGEITLTDAGKREAEKATKRGAK